MRSAAKGPTSSRNMSAVVRIGITEGCGWSEGGDMAEGEGGEGPMGGGSRKVEEEVVGLCCIVTEDMLSLAG